MSLGTCPFCDGSLRSSMALATPLVGVAKDDLPVTDGHRLVFPVHHITTVEQLDPSLWLDLIRGIEHAQASAIEDDPSIDGFNIGINLGQAAGQTVDHLHIHVIPRRSGDTEDPMGGIRNIL